MFCAAGPCNHIRIDEPENIAFRVLRCQIPGGAGTPVDRIDQDRCAHFLRHLRGIIGRLVIDEEQLADLAIMQHVEQRRQHHWQVVSGIISRHHHTDAGTGCALFHRHGRVSFQFSPR